MDQIDRLQSAIRAASPPGADAEPSLTAADLDGILDSVNHVRHRLEGLMAAPPDEDGFETLLVELEVELEHIIWHWNSLAEKFGYVLWAKLETGRE